MSDHRKNDDRSEINFLPPLDMVLTFFDRRLNSRRKLAQERKKARKVNVEKLIENLSEKEKKEE